ncbi:hypothetical protein DID80_00995 [Candidatus Marinamargulisbacteria bacterium SCGC AAA071-K20]|nr:hypothetical protein DID80_00995 [Candidatus Marinamargulisbacteria bacterium SCGC AAA071-K20]
MNLLVTIFIFLYFSTMCFSTPMASFSRKLVKEGHGSAAIKGQLQPSFVKGRLSFSGSDNEAIVDAYIQSFHSTNDTSSSLTGRHVQSQLRSIKVTKEFNDSISGNDVLRVSQQINQIPIFGSDISVQLDSQKKVVLSSGKIYSFDSVPTAPQLSKSEAKKIAKAHLKKGEYNFESIQLVYEIKHNHPYLTWLVVSKTQLSKWHVFVDSISGRVVSSFNAMPYDFSGKSWKTYVTEDSFDLLPQSLVLDGSTGSTINQTVTNLHNNVSQTLDYFYDTFGRRSYDNSGAIVKSVLIENVVFENAYWDSSQLVFGSGNGTTIGPFSVLDITAHELGHAVTTYTSNLVYRNQSGALNESLSDVWGVMVDREDWIIGEDLSLINGQALFIRSFEEPSIGGQPSHMSNFINTEEDNGGVHTNSGIINHAFYKLASSIGKSKSEQLFYRANDIYFVSDTQFMDARFGLVQSAIDLYSDSSAEVASVRAAFDFVGIQPSNIIDVSNLTPTFVPDPQSTPHNYENDSTYTFTFTQRGAIAMKVHFENFNTEADWDFVTILDGNNNEIKKYDGNLGDFESVSVDGDTLIVKLEADTFIEAYGFDISGYTWYSNTSVSASEKFATLNFSTVHPYLNNTDIEKTISIPNAAAFNLSFSRFNTETINDQLKIKSSDGLTLASYSGDLSNFTSKYFLTKTVDLNFTSNSSGTEFGFDLYGANYLEESPINLSRIVLNEGQSSTGFQTVSNSNIFEVLAEVNGVSAIISELVISGSLGTTTLKNNDGALNFNLPSGESLKGFLSLIINGAEYIYPFSELIKLDLPTNDFGLQENLYQLSISSDHPYSSPGAIQETVTIKGAESIRLQFTSFSTDASDVLNLKDKQGNIIASYSGDLGGFLSDRVIGDTVVVEFLSTSGSILNGFDIRGAFYTTETPIPIEITSASFTTEAGLISDFISVENPNLRILLNSRVPGSLINNLTVQVINEFDDSVVLTTPFNNATFSNELIIPIAKNLLERLGTYHAKIIIRHDFGDQFLLSESFQYFTLPNNKYNIPQFSVGYSYKGPRSYTSSDSLNKQIQIDDAKGIQIQFQNFNLKSGDTVYVTSTSGGKEKRQAYSGNKGTFLSDVFFGDTIDITFTPSGSGAFSVNGDDYGFSILDVYYMNVVPVSVESVQANTGLLDTPNKNIESPLYFEVNLDIIDQEVTNTQYLAIINEASGKREFYKAKTNSSRSTTQYTLDEELTKNVTYHAEVGLTQDFGVSYYISPTFLIYEAFKISNLLNGPNPVDPFTDTVKFQFFSNDTGTYEYRIYSISGEELKVETGDITIGFNSLTWTVFNDYNEMLANGVYIGYFKFESNDGQIITDKLKIAVFKR